MPVEGVNGFLDVESAALRAPQVGIANTNPEHILSVGSNLYVSGDSSDVLTVKGNVVSEGLRLGFIEIYPSFDLEAITTVGNVTSNTIIFANVTTGFVTTANVEVGTANLFVDTTVGRVGVGTLDPEATLHVAGDTVVTGNLTVSGTTTTVDTQHLRVTDPLIELGKDNVTEIATDLGIVMTRPAGSSNVAIVYDETATSLNIGYTLGNASQAGISMESGTPLDVNIYGNVHVSSNLEVGTANLFVDTVNSRVGVGKTNPDTALDVVGTVTATALVGTNLYGTLLGSNAASVSSLTASGDVAVNTNTLFVDTTNNRVGVGTVTPSANLHVVGNVYVSSNLEVGTANLFVDTVNSRVGIGTTSPTELLDITAASGDYDAFIRLRSGSGGSPVTESGLKLTESGEFGFQFAHNAETDLLKIRHQSSAGAVDLDDIMVWKPNGNVGIGTTSPNAKLQVNGDIQLNDPEQPIGFGIYHGTHSTLDYFDTLLAKSLRRTADTTFEMQSDGNHAGFSAMDMQFRDIRFYTGTTASPSAVDVNITDLPSYERMCITTTGNVGIGKTDPATALDVLGTIRVQTGTNDATGGEFSIDTNVGHIRRKVAGNGVSLTSYDDFQFYVNATGGSAEGGTQAMIIDNSGNVGIGTTDPTATLELFKGFTATGLYDTATLKFSTTNITSNWDVGSIRGAVKLNAGGTSGFPGGLVFATKSPSVGADGGLTDKMVIDANGNVGIGTSEPLSELDIYKATGGAELLINTGDLNPPTIRLWNFDGNDYNNHAAGTPVGTINFSGNEKLPSDTHTDYTRAFSYANTLYDWARISAIFVGSSSTSTSAGYVRGDLAFYTNNGTQSASDLQERMRIKHDGNVGIGTNSPANSMHIYKDANEQTTGLLISKDNAGTGAAAIFLAVASSVASTGDAVNVPKASILFERNNTRGRGNLKFCVDTADDNNPVVNGNARMTINGTNGNVGFGGNLTVMHYPVSFDNRAGMSQSLSIVNPSSTQGHSTFNVGTLYVGDNVVTEAIAIYNPTASTSYLYKCGYIQWIQVKVRGKGIQDGEQIIKSYTDDSSAVTVYGNSNGTTTVAVTAGTANISYSCKVFYRAIGF